MKALLVSTPSMGHLNPLLSVGRMLIADGYEVMGLCSSYLRDRIESAGAQFHSFLPKADVDPRDLEAHFPEMKTVAPGSAEMLRMGMERAISNYMLPQYESIIAALRVFSADIIIGDHVMCGILPLLLGPRSQRPPVALLGASYLNSQRDDGAPGDAGVPLATNDRQRADNLALAQVYEEKVFGPVGKIINAHLSLVGCPPLHMNIFDAMVLLPDAYLELTVPGFEFPRLNLPTSVHFVGPLPITPNQVPPPSWADDLNKARKVVLVTQGTWTNDDFSQLVLPTIEALADQPDIMVMVTLGGGPVDSLPGPLPGNVRVAEYLPFEWALSKIDAFVTNGGYGSVNQALSFGVPVVTAGTVADRADVGVRVAWSGVGVNLATNAPTADALRSGVRRVLDEPQFRRQAARYAEEARGIDTRSEVLRILNQLVKSDPRRQGAGDEGVKSNAAIG
jgi:UDP:flavonoid glycosyltransferase YjiC (YdhE family)